MPAITATFIESEGEYLEAVIEVDGELLHVMDDFGGENLKAGSKLEVELYPNVFDPGDWDEIFSANPGKKKGLVHLDSWCYLALGKIVNVNPVICDCGLLMVEEPFFTHDKRCIGDYVGIMIGRLDARAS
jgi:hypothetical protein